MGPVLLDALFTVREDNRGNFYYNHRAFEPAQKMSQSAYPAATHVLDRKEPAYNWLNKFLRQPIQRIKPSGRDVQKSFVSGLHIYIDGDETGECLIDDADELRKALSPGRYHCVDGDWSGEVEIVQHGDHVLIKGLRR